MHRRSFLYAIAAAPFAAGWPLHGLAKTTIDEGFDFRRLAQPLPGTRSGKGEVLELFWYGCPHCHQLQPLLEAWRAGHADVAFQRMPAILGEGWKLHARTYYALEALGAVERLHKPLFDAIHLRNRPLGDEARLAAFVAEHGVDARKFRDALGSFAVDAKVRQAAETSRLAGLDGVPALVVNGAWLTSPAITGSRERTLAVVDALLARKA